MREARESFGQALEQLRSEERFRGWLEAQRRLNRYSPRNILWILYQNPEATHVASYKRWREELGYQVRRGEESLKNLGAELAQGDRDRPRDGRGGRVAPPGVSGRQRL